MNFDFEKIKERLLAKREIDETTGCWLYTGNINPKGYGRISIYKRDYEIHRLSFIIFIGPVINNVLHKQECPNRHCFNPEHLYDGTQADNIKDIIELGHNPNINKTHCKYGHEYTPENTIYDVSRNQRHCKTCKNEKYKLNKI